MSERSDEPVLNHPTLRELRDHLRGERSGAVVEAHLDGCAACAALVDDVLAAADQPNPSADVVSGIVAAAGPVLGLVGLALDRDEREPEAGELWRAGGEEALLVWVRRNFGDGAVDVVPVVFDVDFADEQTLLVEPHRTPLGVQMGAMVALRTHIDREAFIGRLCGLDLAAEVDEVIAATGEGRVARAAVGPAVEFGDDDRIDYRQSVSEALAELWPGEFAPGMVPPADPFTEPSVADVADVRAQITLRVRSATCLDLPLLDAISATDLVLRPLCKVAYLNTSVVVAWVPSLVIALDQQDDLIEAGHRLLTANPDANAFCVTQPGAEWDCAIYSSASMRRALALPRGDTVGPAPVLVGLGLVDGLAKYLDGAVAAWELTDRTSVHLGEVDLTDIVRRHTEVALAGIVTEGRAARQAPKRATWSTPPPDLDRQVREFITSVVRSTPVDEAVARFIEDAAGD